jgi:hypothetical protein
MGFTLDRCRFEIMQGWSDDGDNVTKVWGERKWEVWDWIETKYCSYVEKHVAIPSFPGSVPLKLLVQSLGTIHSISPQMLLQNLRMHQYWYAWMSVYCGSGYWHPTISWKFMFIFAKQTYIDQTYWAAIEQVHLHLGNNAAWKVLDGSAWAVICNVWQPLIGPVFNLPLAVADFGTLDNQRGFRETLPAPPGCWTRESQMLHFHPNQKCIISLACNHMNVSLNVSIAL